MLSESEHERWMQSRLDDEWVLDSETDPAKKMHKCLVSWNELPEDEKEKDRVLVCGIP